MLRITIELIPKGNEKEKQVIGTLEIINDQTSKNPKIGNYDFTMTSPSRTGLFCKGRLVNFLRIKGHWACLKACLENINVDKTGG